MQKITNSHVEFLCRRGMKEIEDILYPFFYKHYSHLTQPLQNAFIELLNHDDPELYDWILLKKEDSSSLSYIIAEIKRYVDSI